MIVDSNAEDTRIVSSTKSREAIKAYLKGMTQGKICDTWNRDDFHSIDAEEQSILQLPWNAITVETLSFNLEDLKQIPSKQRRFLLEKLETLGFKTAADKRNFFFSNDTQNKKLLPETVDHIESKQQKNVHTHEQQTPTHMKRPSAKPFQSRGR